MGLAPIRALRSRLRLPAPALPVMAVATLVEQALRWAGVVAEWPVWLRRLVG